MRMSTRHWYASIFALLFSMTLRMGLKTNAIPMLALNPPGNVRHPREHKKLSTKLIQIGKSGPEFCTTVRQTATLPISHWRCPPGRPLRNFLLLLLWLRGRVFRRPLSVRVSRSVLFSRWVLCDSLGPHGLQHARLPCPSPTPRSLLKLMSIQSVMPSNHLILCRPLLPPSIFPSIRVFSSESVLRIRCPEYWSFSFGIIPSKEYSGLISFGLADWISLQSKGLPRVFSNTTVQKHLRHSAFFMVQLSHPYVTTGKTVALTDGPLLAK